MTENRRGRPRFAVGYVRVSTRRQAEEGNGLEAQAEALRRYAREHGYTLRGIREDTTSGNDRRALTDREEFRDAVKDAKDLKAAIIVTRLHRVSRNTEKFRQFLQREKIRIVSMVPGETEDIAAQRRAVARGQQVREKISEGTVRALASKKQQGVALGYPASLPAANRASRKIRGTKSHLKVLDIRDLLLRHPDLREASAATVAERLNAAGILSGRDLLWTKDSIRRQLRLARKELKLFEEPDDDF